MYLFIIGEIKIKQKSPYGSVEFSGHLEVANILIHNFDLIGLEIIGISNPNSTTIPELQDLPGRYQYCSSP